ncbi:MAG: Hint domain-containing protein [Pseudomonadota bacterium]
MPSFTIFGLSGDPLFNTTLTVDDAYSVEITDDDAVLEDPDQNGTPQFDTSGIPGVIDSSNLQVFEDYSAEVNGLPVTFTLIRFSGQDLIFVKTGVIADGDTIENIAVTSFAGQPIDYTDLPTFICFTPGALIATPEGERPVEALEVGDFVTTRDHGAQPIRFVARRSFSRRELAAFPHFKPVLIRKGALGPETPRRDIRVSPQHRMVLSGWRAEVMFGASEVMATAISLVNDKMIRIAHGARRVTYIHLLFDQHEVIFAEDAATESLHPGRSAVDSMQEDSRAELLEIFPELALQTGDNFGAVARPALRKFEGTLIARTSVARRPSAVKRADRR